MTQTKQSKLQTLAATITVIVVLLGCLLGFALPLNPEVAVSFILTGTLTGYVVSCEVALDGWRDIYDNWVNRN